VRIRWWDVGLVVVFSSRGGGRNLEGCKLKLRFRGRACSREEDPVGWVSGFRGRAMEELVVREEGKVVK